MKQNLSETLSPHTAMSLASRTLSTQRNEKLYELIGNAIRNRSHLLLCGDFNHPEIDWVQEVSPQNVDHKATVFMNSIVRDFS